MCGIAGFFRFDGQPAEEVILMKMGNSIAHRGPDGEGPFTDGACGLVHKRLAIVDLSPNGSNQCRRAMDVLQFPTMVNFSIIQNCALNCLDWGARLNQPQILCDTSGICELRSQRY